MKQNTFHAIQMFRALAAGIVVLFHAHQDAEYSKYMRVFSGEDYLFAFGEVGVHIFFVISGFVIMISRGGDEGYRFSDFIVKRFIRIYPIYWIVLAFSLLVFALINRVIHADGLQFVGTVLLWPGEAPRYISPAWTLTYEVYFYLCFGLATLSGRRRGLIALSAFFVTMVGLRHFVDTENAVLDVVTNGLLLEFLAGAWIGFFALRGKLPTAAGPYLVAGAVLLYGAGLSYGYKKHASTIMWGLPSIMLIGGAVCWELRSGASRLVRLIGQFGDGSYVLYLLHKSLQWAMVALLAALLPRMLPNALVFTIVAAIICLFCGELAYRHVERPALKSLRRRLLPQGSRSAPTARIDSAAA